MKSFHVVENYHNSQLFSVNLRESDPLHILPQHLPHDYPRFAKIEDLLLLLELSMFPWHFLDWLSEFLRGANLIVVEWILDGIFHNSGATMRVMQSRLVRF